MKYRNLKVAYPLDKGGELPPQTANIPPAWRLLKAFARFVMGEIRTNVYRIGI